MESKVVSLRVPEQLLEKLDRLAEQRYPNRKSNRSQVILDAIELIVEQGLELKNNDDIISVSTVNDIVDKRIGELEKKLLSTVNDIVNKKIEEYSIDSKNTMNDIVDIKETKEINTVSDTVNKNHKLSLRSAFELAQSRGYRGSMKTFSGVFTKHKDEPDFSLCDIKRNHKEGKEKVTYTDVYDVNTSI